MQQYNYRSKKVNEELFPISGKDLEEILHRFIVAITFLNKNRMLCSGSGVLISKDIVLTAAQNVFDRDQQFNFDDHKVYFGADGTSKEYYQVEDIRYMEEFKNCQRQKEIIFDFALLKLKKEVEQTDFLKVSAGCQACLMGNNRHSYLHLFGFPHNYKGNFQPLDKFDHQFKLCQFGRALKNRIIKIDPSQHKICYGVSTLEGQNGCPVIIDGKIIAIHIGSGRNKQQFSVGRLLDLPLLAKLEEWCKELKGDSFSIKDKQSCLHLQENVKNYLPNKQMKQLKLAGKQLKQININEYTNLAHLYLSNNQLSAIDVTKNINLVRLQLQNNQLSAIDLTKNTNLTHLSLYNNQLSAVNLTKNTKLIWLCLQDNKILQIDVTKNTNLTWLYLNNNQLSAIDTTTNNNLNLLYIQNNKLPEIDLRKNIRLTYLNLQNNQLRAINFMKNTNLDYLNIKNNQLSTIDATKNSNLTFLLLQKNKCLSISLLFSAEKPFKHYLDDSCFNFSDQSQNTCKIHLQYNSADKAKCNELKDKWTKKYGNTDYNKHACKYVFITLQR